ncbi:TrmH family RNA methyltransferase [Balneola vulgaris]|uniref:TrmH family RNA methyltransferase n=1 Tax=Balneola vulgaris TaxID=287535 RepID=UPI00036CC1F2|nr:RNA methyltransferase [Balneola vulgaris]
MKKASNNQIKLLRKLSQRKFREKEGLFLVEGLRAVEQILQNKYCKVQAVFWGSKTSPEAISVSIQEYELDQEIFDEVSDTESPQGVIAVAEIPEEKSIAHISAQANFLIATDRIQDPGNMGTIIRTAAWFGVDGILVGKGSVDIFNPKVVRSTVGATGALEYRSSNLEAELELLEKEGWTIYLLDGHPGALELSTIPIMAKTVVVVGNEANGISDALKTKERQRVMIPLKGDAATVESLNAAIALSIALYQLKG